MNLLTAKKRETAYALLIVMATGAVLTLAVGATINRMQTSARLNDRNRSYLLGLYAAEAATEKVIARMRYDYMSGSDTLVANNLALYRGYVPSSSESTYWTNFNFSDAQGNASQTYVQIVSNKVYTPLQSQYAGLNGWRTVYRVVSNSRQTSNLYNVTNAVLQDVEMDSVPVFQFAIFYNSLLEFTWAAPMTIRGRTHANGQIFLGSTSPINFNDLVTSTSQILKTNWDGHTLSQYTGSITFATNISGGYSTNVPVLQLPIGTNNTASAVREILNIPPTSEDPTSVLGKQRFYNMHGVDLLVSNTMVTAMLRGSDGDTSPLYITSTNTAAALATNFPFLTITNTFTDQRESKTIIASQIDIGKYNRWLLTNSSVATKFPSGSGVYPNILYIADNRTTNTSTKMLGVRLIDGTSIPTNGTTGLTVATPNPLYVLGNYNCPVSSALGTTNTSAVEPAALMSDALTILSGNWQDSHSNDSFDSGVRVASSTTVNAAILTGIVYSNPTSSSDSSHFSGGAMNLPRLLEDWGNGGSTTLTLNTSIVNFFNSTWATNWFQNPGVYYYAPSRQFNFDSNFKSASRLPPGTPELGAILRSRWAVVPPNTTTYAGP